MRLLPVVLLLPLFLLLLVARHVRRVAEADRLPHALVAHGAADPVERMRRAAAKIRRQVGMGGEGLRVLLVPLLVDGKVTGLAPVHLRHADEVHVVDDVGQDDLLDLERRGHEIEERRVPEVILHARRDDLQPLAQARLLGCQIVDLLLDRRHLAGVLAELPLKLRFVGFCLFFREVELGQTAFLVPDDLPLPGGAGRAGDARGLEVVAILVVGRFHGLVVGRRAVQAVVGVLELVLQLVHLLLICFDVLPRGRLLRLELRQLAPVDRSAGLLEVGLRDLHFELPETPLRALPVAVVVIPDHPDDRQEQE